MFYQSSQNNKLKNKYLISKIKASFKEQNMSSICKFAKQKCQQYIQQIITPSKNQIKLKDEYLKHVDKQPESKQLYSRKKIQLIPFTSFEKGKQNKNKIKKSSNINLHTKFQKQKPVKLFTRSKTLHSKSPRLCVPLEIEHQTIERPTVKVIQLLRSIKQRDRKLQQVQKSKKQNQNIEKQKVLTVVGQKKNYKQRSTTLAFGYQGDPILILNDNHSEKPSHIEMQVKVIDKNQFCYERGINKLKRHHKKKQFQNLKQNKVRVSSLHVQRFQDLNTDTSKCSEFLNTFFNLKLKSQVTMNFENKMQTKKVIKQNIFNDLFDKQTHLAKSKSVCLQQIKNKCVINIVDNQLLKNQLLHKQNEFSDSLYNLSLKHKQRGNPLKITQFLVQKMKLGQI